MKYQGQEIGLEPTLTQIECYVCEKGFTYVADDMLFEEQRERQTKINRERFRFKKDGVY